MDQDKNRVNLADYDLVAVSRLKESVLNTEQTLDVCFSVDRGTVLGLEDKIETDENILRGMEEVSELYYLGSQAGHALAFPMAMAQHIAFGLGYGLGVVASAAYGTGYKHGITPLESKDQPTFTSAMRFGKTIGKRRLAGQAVDQLTLTCGRNAWTKLDLAIKGTGKFADTVYEETISAAFNSTTLNLATNGVAGATAAERLANVHAVYALDPVGGQRIYVDATAASGAVPAVITIPAPGGAVTVTTFKVLYVPVEPAWATFPARVIEPPLRTSDCSLIIGGKYSAGDIVGGYPVQADIKTLTYKLVNALDVDPRMGGTGTYSNYLARTGRLQTISLDQELRNWLLEQAKKNVDYLGLKLSLLGAEFESGKNYGAKGFFPKCGIVKKTISVDGKVLAEAGDLQVLEDGTNKTAYWEVYNKVAAYVG